MLGLGNPNLIDDGIGIRDGVPQWTPDTEHPEGGFKQKRGNDILP